MCEVLLFVMPGSVLECLQQQTSSQGGCLLGESVHRTYKNRPAQNKAYAPGQVLDMHECSFCGTCSGFSSTTITHSS